MFQYVKLILALFVFQITVTKILALSDEMQALMDNLHKQCQSETGVPEVSIENARKGDFSEDENLKCYIKCILAEVALIDEDNGQIDVDGTIAVLPDELQDEMSPVVKACGTQAGANLCETAWLTHKCYQKAKPMLYFLP